MKQKFPFSKYAVLAELALADTQFARGAYQEAIDAYKTFARLHPTHEKVEDGYVAYKICECYAQDMPGDWFLVPPSYEKDQTAVRDAYRELSDFLDKYPDSKYVDDVKKLRRDVIARLIEHEVYVARFYLDTGHSKAAILRLESALQRLPRVGARGRAAAGAGADPPRDGQRPAARDTFSRVVQEFGTALQARRAQLYLEFIRKRHGDNPQNARGMPRRVVPARAPPMDEKHSPAAGARPRALREQRLRQGRTLSGADPEGPPPVRRRVPDAGRDLRPQGPEQARPGHVRGGAAVEPRPTPRRPSTWR